MEKNLDYSVCTVAKQMGHNSLGQPVHKKDQYIQNRRNQLNC